MYKFNSNIGGICVWNKTNIDGNILWVSSCYQGQGAKNDVPKICSNCGGRVVMNGFNDRKGKKVKTSNTITNIEYRQKDPKGFDGEFLSIGDTFKIPNDKEDSLLYICTEVACYKDKVCGKDLGEVCQIPGRATCLTTGEVIKLWPSEKVIPYNISISATMNYDLLTKYSNMTDRVPSTTKEVKDDNEDNEDE